MRLGHGRRVEQQGDEDVNGAGRLDERRGATQIPYASEPEEET